MDHAICYGPNRTIQKLESLSHRYCNAIIKDDKKEFLSIIKDPKFCRESADLIFHYDALHIGVAVLNGETKGTVDLQNTGRTPLHLAARFGAPRLTNYLLQSGADINAMCHSDRFKQYSDQFKQYNVLDMALQTIEYDEETSLFDILLNLCHRRRKHLEVIRLLVRSSQCPKYVQKTFIKYADKAQLAPLAALFLAAPEFFLSSYKNVTDIHYSEEMTLLLDIINMVGDKLVAYIRLQQTSDQIREQTTMEIAFLLHQVPLKKLGVSSPDYFFRFFKKPSTLQLLDRNFDDKPVVPETKTTWDSYEWHEEKPGPWMYSYLPDIVTGKDIDKADIFRGLPTLEPDDEGRLNRSMEKKLSSMSSIKGVFEGMMGQISNKGQKHLPQSPKWFPSLVGRNFERNVKLFHTYAPTPNHMVDFEIAQTWQNKVMKLVKPKFNFLAMLSYFPTVAKRLIK